MKLNLEKFQDILGEKKLYSPGPVPQTFTMKIDFSHRSKEFEELYLDTKRKLREKFSIPSEYEILFIQGSGTCAIESVIGSLYGYSEMVVQVDGVFGERASSIAKKFHCLPKQLCDARYFYYVQFETSKSIYFEPFASLLADYDLVVADCISGFGFYPLPKADIIIASSSKILGGLPVLGIVLFNQKAKSLFQSNGDYLNLLNYIEYDKTNRTPHTSLIPQLLSLNEAIPSVISREQIITNCRALYSDRIQVIGEKVCPVLTIKVSDPEKWVEEFRKYNAEVYWNSQYMEGSFQVSMFNYRNSGYYELLRVILEEGL